MIVATSKAGEDPILKKAIDDLKLQAAAESTAVLKGEQSKWMLLPTNGWTGDLFDYNNMAKPFDRKQSNDWFIAATSNAGSPGTTADLVVTTLQIDYLSVMERSFRSRHTMSRQRAMCHAMGRKQGHGTGNGPFEKAVLEYIRGVISDGSRK